MYARVLRRRSFFFASELPREPQRERVGFFFARAELLRRAPRRVGGRSARPQHLRDFGFQAGAGGRARAVGGDVALPEAAGRTDPGDHERDLAARFAVRERLRRLGEGAAPKLLVYLRATRTSVRSAESATVVSFLRYRGYTEKKKKAHEKKEKRPRVERTRRLILWW